MKKLCLLLFSIAIAITSFAATKYVTPGGSGSGASWSDPASTSIINSAASGDLIYLGGGNYGNGIAINASGITIRRGTAADHGSDTGWSSSLDTQAVFNTGVNVSGSKVTIDGNCWKPPGLPTKFGILIKHGSGAKGIDAGGSGGNLTVRDVDVAGPGFNSSTQEADGIHFPDNSLITGCASHDTDALLFSWNPNSNSTIEYSLLYNASSAIVSNPGVGPHPDLWYTGSGAINSIVRWCFIANFVSEGFFFDNNQAGSNMTWYGNVMIQGDTQTGAVPIEFQNGAAFGTVFLYHNTFVDFGKANNLGPGTTIASGSALKNNLWINCGTTFTNLTNNGFSSGGAGASPIVNPASPFVTSGTYVWKLGSGTPPATRVTSGVPQGYNPNGMQTAFVLASNSWAAGKAIAVPSGMNVDMNGASGNNLGAFQSGGTAPTPTPATPTPTPTATPTATPTPAPTATPAPPAFAVGDYVTPSAGSTVNVRSTPAGTQTGTHVPPDLGVILAGPTAATFNGAMVQWYNIDWAVGADGWSGADLLVKTAGPTPTPKPTATPTPTPIPSYHNWEAKLNAEMATGVSSLQLMSWINANPPTAD